MKGLTLLLLSALLTPSLSQVQAVIHMAYIGSRYPLKTLPNIDWKFNPTELTPIGIRQLYLLGREIRRLYVNLTLSERYNVLNTGLRSFCSTNKVFSASAYAFASGLYHPGTGYELTSFQNKRAVPPVAANFSQYQEELEYGALLHFAASVPVMTITEEPNYLFEAATMCPNVKTLVDDTFANNATLKAFIEKQEAMFKKDLYPHIKQILELPKDIASLDEAMDYYDYLISAKYEGKKFKQAVTEADYKLLEELHYTVKYMKLLTNLEVAKVISYGLLTEMNSTLSNIVEHKADTQRFTTYMLDDVNILAFLRLLQCNDPKLIALPFASSLAIEITKEEKVTIKLNNVTVPLPKGFDNSLGSFTRWINDNTLTDFKNTCVFIDISVGTKWFVITIIIGVVFIILVIVTWILIHKCRRTKEETEELGSGIDTNQETKD